MVERRRRKRKGAANNDTIAAEYSSPACFMQELEVGRSASGASGVRIKRIYDEPERTDGFRVLVDRLWPRGMKKENAAIDAWARELAPSSELRKWFRHDPLRWTEFRRRYRQELHEHADVLEALRQRSRQQPVTLLYAARDIHINHAVVLRQVIEDHGLGASGTT